MQLEDGSADRLPTTSQLKSQTKSLMRCCQASVQQHINKPPQHGVAKTPEVSLLGKRRQFNLWNVTAQSVLGWGCPL